MRLVAAGALAVALSAPLAMAAAPMAPMTEEEYASVMSDVGAAYLAMRENMSSGKFEAGAADARRLALFFDQVEAFWAGHKKTDAVGWAGRARSQANYLAGIADAARRASAVEGATRANPNQLKIARTAAMNMGATCRQCHTAYRDGDESSGYSIKAGVLVK